MHAIRTTTLCLCLCLGIATSATAALTVSLSPDQVELGPAGGTVKFTASIEGDAGEQIQGYDFYLDISNVDLNAGPSPVQIALIDFLSLESGLSFADPRIPGESGRDFGATLFNFSGGESTSGGLDLFSFDATFAANDDKTPDVFEFRFTPSAPGFSLTVNNQLQSAEQLSEVGFGTATVTVAAVPEPACLFIGGLVGTTWMLRRRRHERAVASPNTNA